MSPLEIRVALHYYYSPEQWHEVEKISPASDEAHTYLFAQKMLAMIAEPGRLFAGTDKLKAYVEHLCSQPLPECRWVIPTEVIA